MLEGSQGLSLPGDRSQGCAPPQAHTCAHEPPPLGRWLSTCQWWEGESQPNLSLRRAQMGPGVAQEGWNTRKWGYLWERSQFPGCSLPPLPALGLASVVEPVFGSVGKRQASGSVPLSDHMRMATLSTGGGSGSVHLKPQGLKPSLWGPSLHQLPTRGREPTDALPMGSGPAGLGPIPCLTGPWLYNPFVGQSLWEGGAGGTEAPLSRPRTRVGVGG